jgi:hypothetical protein
LGLAPADRTPQQKGDKRPGTTKEKRRRRMTYKAKDFEKKMGECPKHGEQVMWLGCKHVGKGFPKEIWLGPNRIAICPECAGLPEEQIEGELLMCCEACIKNKIKGLSDRLPKGAKIYDHVKGLDVYEEELLTD